MSEDVLADTDQDWLGPMVRRRVRRGPGAAPGGLDGDALPAALHAMVARWDSEEAAGPHLVIAVGSAIRYFGPFPTAAQARRAAAAETAAWRAEFPGTSVLFEVAPLVDGAQLAPSG